MSEETKTQDAESAQVSEATEQQIRDYQKKRIAFIKANLPFLKAETQFEELQAAQYKARFEQQYYKMKLAEISAPPSAEELEAAAKRAKEKETQKTSQEDLAVVK